MALIEIVETASYLRDAEQLLSEQERDELISSLAANPLQGVLIKGTGGLRKMRVGLAGRGKRGGGRVIYWFHSSDYPLVLMLLFAKNRAADLTHEQKAILVKLADQMRIEYGVRK